MFRRGREPWSNRLIVEDCSAFDMVNLVRSGVFHAKPGTLCSIAWKNPGDQDILGAYFYVELTANGTSLLRISYGVPSGRPLVRYGQSESVEIVQTELRFGPRRWFLCPGTHRNTRCQRRTRILYFAPNSRTLGCRKCLNLTYRSVKEHDQRIDELLKLSPDEFARVLTGTDTRRALLAVRASMVRYERLRKKAAKYPPPLTRKSRKPEVPFSP